MGRKGKGRREETKVKDTEGRNEEGGERKLEEYGGVEEVEGGWEVNDKLFPV